MTALRKASQAEMTMRLRIPVPTGNPNEIETTTRLACQRHCHAPRPLSAPAFTEFHCVAFRFVSFRVTFTSTIQQTIGKCGHKAMTVLRLQRLLLPLGVASPPPCVHIPLCLAVLPNAQSGNGCGCGNTCMRVAAVATGSCCCCDWRRCRVHVNVDVEFTSAVAAGSAISQHVANRLSPARPHTVRRRLKPSVNCIQINGPRQRDLAMSKAA